MTAPIPNYSETVTIGQAIANDIFHQFTDRELVAAAYPRPDNPLPLPTTKWFYSNTNNILAALIIEKGGTFRVLVDAGLIKITQPPGTLNLRGGDPE